MTSPIIFSVSVAFQYTVVCKSLFMQFIKQFIKESLSFSSIFLASFVCAFFTELFLLLLFPKPGSNNEESFAQQSALSFSLKCCGLLLEHVMIPSGLILFYFIFCYFINSFACFFISSIVCLFRGNSRNKIVIMIFLCFIQFFFPEVREISFSNFFFILGGSRRSSHNHKLSITVSGDTSLR